MFPLKHKFIFYFFVFSFCVLTTEKTKKNQEWMQNFAILKKKKKNM